MKKILATIAILLVLVGCSSGNIMKDYPGFTKTDHHFEAISSKDLIESLEAKKPGAYFLGFPECPWCQALVPVLEEALTETNTTIHYLNIRGAGFTEDDQKQLTAWDRETPGTQSQSGETEGLSVPYIIVIDKDGNVQTRTGTFEGHTDPKEPLTDTQKIFIKNQLIQMFKSLD